MEELALLSIYKSRTEKFSNRIDLSDVKLYPSSQTTKMPEPTCEYCDGTGSYQVEEQRFV